MELIEDFGDRMFEWFKEGTSRYWLKSFCIEEMVPPQRVSDFAEQSEYFAWVLSLCKAIQEERLVALGVDKTNGQAMPVFALKNVAGWKDEPDIQANETTARLAAQWFAEMVQAGGTGFATSGNQPVQV